MVIAGTYEAKYSFKNNDDRCEAATFLKSKDCPIALVHAVCNEGEYEEIAPIMLDDSRHSRVEFFSFPPMVPIGLKVTARFQVEVDPEDWCDTLFSPMAFDGQCTDTVIETTSGASENPELHENGHPYAYGF